LKRKVKFLLIKSLPPEAKMADAVEVSTLQKARLAHQPPVPPTLRGRTALRRHAHPTSSLAQPGTTSVGFL
jgi:hypothetical protein